VSCGGKEREERRRAIPLARFIFSHSNSGNCYLSLLFSSVFSPVSRLRHTNINSDSKRQARKYMCDEPTTSNSVTATRETDVIEHRGITCCTCVREWDSGREWGKQVNRPYTKTMIRARDANSLTGTPLRACFNQASSASPSSASSPSQHRSSSVMGFQ